MPRRQGEGESRGDLRAAWCSSLTLSCGRGSLVLSAEREDYFASRALARLCDREHLQDGGGAGRFSRMPCFEEVYLFAKHPASRRLSGEVMMALHMKNRLRRCFLALGGMVALFVVAAGILVFDGLHDRLGKADVAVVLGSKVELDGKPSTRLRARLDRTLELYKAGYFPKVIVSGGTGKEGYDEAAVMKDYLVSQGIPADRVILDSDGVTTFATAENVMKIAREQGFQSALVVTQYFHVPRSRMILQRSGMPVVYSAHAYLFEWRDVYSTPRELIGYVSYLFRPVDAAAAKRP